MSRRTTGDDRVRVQEIPVHHWWDERAQAYCHRDDEGRLTYTRDPPRRFIPVAPLALIVKLMGERDEGDGT